MAAVPPTWAHQAWALMHAHADPIILQGLGDRARSIDVTFRYMNFEHSERERPVTASLQGLGAELQKIMAAWERGLAPSCDGANSFFRQQREGCWPRRPPLHPANGDIKLNFQNSRYTSTARAINHIHQTLHSNIIGGVPVMVEDKTSVPVEGYLVCRRAGERLCALRRFRSACEPDCCRASTRASIRLPTDRLTAGTNRSDCMHRH